jgi:predicted secreted protein
MRPPPNFSGAITILLRGQIIDYTTSAMATKKTEPKPLAIEVFPVADGIREPTDSYGIEDLGPVAFGSTLVNTKLRANDRGTGAGNNPETETFIDVVIQVPEDNGVTYEVSRDLDGCVPGEVSFDAATRTYRITSTTISGDLAALSLQQRKTAEKEILDTLETFQVEIGPAHTDKNGQLSISITTLDVNLGRASTKTTTFTHDIIIQAVADTPTMQLFNAPATEEDGAPVPLKIAVGSSDDIDGSEVTFLRIIVPQDAGDVPGIISALAMVPAGLSLREPIDNVYVVSAEGSSVQQRLSLLNSFVNDESGQGLQFVPSAHWSGKITLTVQVVSAEMAEGDELAPDEYGGPDGTSKPRQLPVISISL